MCCGYDQLSEARRLALLLRLLGPEGYPICIELCRADIGYYETETRLANRSQPRQSAIYSRAQFKRRNQHFGENCMQFVMEVRTLAARCRYTSMGVDGLIRDRFVPGLNNDRISEQLFLQIDNLTLD